MKKWNIQLLERIFKHKPDWLLEEQFFQKEKDVKINGKSNLPITIGKFQNL